MKTAWLTLLLPVAVLAAEPKLPDGWRDLKFGMSEKQVEKKALEYRTKTDREWEQTGATALYVPDVASKKLAQRDLDGERFKTWMIVELDEGASTVRTYFDGGKLFAVRAMGRISFQDYVKKAAAAYGAEPERIKLTVTDETSTGKPSDTKVLDAAVWRGAKSTAIIFQPSGWGPELLIISNAGLKAVKQSLKKPETPAESSTRF